MSFFDWILELLSKYFKKDEEEKPKPPPVVDPKPTTEEAKYHGRFNGDRPTWYFKKKMSDYPRSLTLSVPGCYESLHIAHNGVRYETGGVILKQSDVSGRGMALVLPASCKGTKATIAF